MHVASVSKFLSRNDPFSMPVIQCLGSFLGITASSLSVSILMALASSVTRAHGLSPADSAKTGMALAITTSISTISGFDGSSVGKVAPLSCLAVDLQTPAHAGK